MTYNKKTVIATKEDAEEVLHNGFAYDNTIYGMAVDFLQQNFPESRALGQLVRDKDGHVDMRVSQYNAAKMYETRVQASGGAADEDLSADANRYIQEFEARSDMAEDGAAIDIDENITPISADDSFDELLGSLQEFEQDDAWRDVVKDVLDRTEFYYTSEDEEGKDFAKTVWETVKTKILVNRTLNPQWQAVMRKGGAEKEEWLQEEIKNVYTAEVVTQAGASKIKKPNKKQQVLGSQEHADYIAGVAKKSQETFDRYVRKNKKLKISSTMVVAGAGNAWAKLKGFIDFSEAKQLGENFIGKVKGYRDSFDEKMQQRHPKLWGWAKNIAESAKASKWQTISGLVATGAVVLSGAGAGMLTAYAAYMAVSSWIWPIANKKALELNRAKKTGNKETIASWKGKEGWSRAKTSIFANKRETKNYILKGTIGTIFAGVAGYLANNTELAAGLFGNSEALAKASRVTKGMIIRTQQAIIRSVGAVTGQFATWLGDGISYLRDKTGENKAYFKQSSIGLGLSALLAGGATWWQLHNLHWLENTAVAEGLVVGSAAPKDLPEGAKLLAETDKGGRAYQLGDRVIFEENGKVARNVDKSAFDNYKGDASDENGAAKLLAYDEAKQAKVAKGLVIGSAAPKDLPEGAKLLAQNEHGRIYDIAGWVIQEKDGKILNNNAAEHISNYSRLSHDGKVKWANKLLKATTTTEVSPEVQENEALIYFFGKDVKGNAFVPTEYTAGLGVTQNEWDYIQDKLVGYMRDSNNAAHVGSTAVDHDVVYDTAIRNLATYMYQNKEAFPEDASPVKYLHDFLRRHYLSVGNIHRDGDIHGIATKVNGEWKYGNSAFNNDMNALSDIICNGSTSRTNLNLSAPFENLNEDLNEAHLNGNGNYGIGYEDCDPKKARTVYIMGKRAPKIKAEISEQSTTREVLSEKQQVVEAPTTREIISEDTKPVENNKYFVRKVRYVNKGNADTQLGDQDLNGHTKFKGSYSVAGRDERR